MCFLVHPKHAEEKTAKKDIKCWKVVCEDFSNYNYVINGMPHIKYDKLKTYRACNRSGEIIKKIVVKEDGSGIKKIYEGIHSYSKQNMIFFYYTDGLIIKCIIPKGTKYYYNPEDKEYISLKIKRIK